MDRKPSLHKSKKPRPVPIIKVKTCNLSCTSTMTTKYESCAALDGKHSPTKKSPCPPLSSSAPSGKVPRQHTPSDTSLNKVPVMSADEMELAREKALAATVNPCHTKSNGCLNVKELMMTINEDKPVVTPTEQAKLDQQIVEEDARIQKENYESMQIDSSKGVEDSQLFTSSLSEFPPELLAMMLNANKSNR